MASNVDDLRIGSYGVVVTYDVGGTSRVTFGAEWAPLGTITATVNGTAVPVEQAGLVATVTWPAAITSSLTRTAELTVFENGIPLFRGPLMKQNGGSSHGDTSADTTVVVRDSTVVVTTLGPPGLNRVEIDGGSPISTYLDSQDIDGGTP